VPLVLGLWLALIGYTIAWAGWRNLGITYHPGSNGSITPSQNPVTLLDAFTGKEPATLAAAAGPSASNFLTPASQAVTASANAAAQGAALVGRNAAAAAGQLGGRGAGAQDLLDSLARGTVHVVDYVRIGAGSLHR
jgi:hypothetical protein